MKVFAIAHMDNDDYNLNVDSVFAKREDGEERLQILFEDHKDHVDEDGNGADLSEWSVECYKCMQYWQMNEMEVKQ